jgi:predicted amidohydrolase YtcJ
MRSGLVLGPTWNGAEEAERVMRDWLSFARGRGIGDPMLRISGIFVPSYGNLHMNTLLRRNIADLGWSDYIRLVDDPEGFEQMCRLAGKHDLRVHTVVSDRLHEVVPILERLAKIYPIGERRWVLEHVSRAGMPDLRKVKEMGLGVTLIPANYVWKGARHFRDLSDEQLDLLSPAKQLIELGVPVSAGTDAVPYDPLFGMWTMVTRQERVSRRVIGPNGRLSNEAALRLSTVCGAWLTFEEDVKGPLLPGYYADLAVLARDPLATPGDEILQNECTGTMVGGKWVYGPR